MSGHDLKTGDCLADSFNGVRGWLTLEEAAELRRLSQDRVVLEIGSYCGRSAIEMARENASRVYALDWHRGDGCIGSQETAREFLDNVRMFQNIIPLVGMTNQLASALGESWADLVYVDGEHSYESAVDDLRLAKKCLKPGGTIAVHDWDYPQVVRAFNTVFGFPLGPERQVDKLYVAEDIYKGESMSTITVEDLLKEQAGLEQQAAQHKETMAKADQVRAVAANNLEAVHGALQMTNHLLNKIKTKEQTDGGRQEAGAYQEQPGDRPACTPGADGSGDA